MSLEREQPGADAPDLVSDTQRVRLAIARAKFEWECTVDALPDLICLLDADGHVVRVNRVVERWDLGSIGGALGRDLHTLLHGRCVPAGCALHTALTAAWAASPDGQPREFELRDAILGRALRVTLRPVAPRSGGAPAPTDCVAVAVVADVTALHLAREALHSINAELETRVRVRTDELNDANRDLQNEIMRREAAEQALRRSRNELEALSRRQIAEQEIERKRIARELHDSVGQQLSAVKYTLERLELAPPGTSAESQQLVRRVISALQDVLEELRGIAMNLRPPMLDDLGAASAVLWFCREFKQSYLGLEVHEAVSVSDAAVPERLSTAVFRSVQELLNNVAKHAQARNVVVSLSRTADQLVLEVIDDGIGVRTESPGAPLRSGRGIYNLRERAEMTGGQFTLSAREAGPGSRARIEWRLAPGEDVKPDAA
jgi:signal transduction histidine kinase